MLLLCLGQSLAQTSSTVSLSNGVQLRITSTPPADGSAHLKAEMKPAGGNSVYRLYRDETGLAVYAYELVVDRLPDGNHFQILAKPAGEEFATKFPNADGGKPTPTMSQSLASAPLVSGGRFTVEIPTNPGWSEHRVDTIQIGFGGGVAESKPLLRFAGLRVAVNGAAIPVYGGSVVAGRYLMFYIPGKGGYFFSTQPVDARPFVQSGVVDGARLKFVINNATYECVAEAPILVDAPRGQLWVYYDPNYKPAGNLTKNTSNLKSAPEFFTAASDSLDWWIP